jgi:hypothetical protein
MDLFFKRMDVAYTAVWTHSIFPGQRRDIFNWNLIWIEDDWCLTQSSRMCTIRCIGDFYFFAKKSIQYFEMSIAYFFKGEFNGL